MKEHKEESHDSVSKLNTSLDNITKVVASVKGQTQRNFVQTVEAGINIEGINFKQTQNRIGFEVVLPHAFKKMPKTVLFASSPNFISGLESAFDKVITAEQIPTLDKKGLKRMAADYDLFLAEPTTLTLVGKFLGQTLAPRGKMPKPCPPDANAVKAIINNASKAVTVANKKGEGLPVLHFPIGKENMTDKEIAENFLAVYTKLLPLLPGTTQNLKSMYIKTTMGPIKYIFKR